MTINQAIVLARKIISKHSELRYWTVTSNNRKRAFGVCSYTNRQIELSSHLVPVMTDEAINDTIVHEIAHALCPNHSHDNVWKQKCIELGGSGQRCGGVEKYKNGKDGMIDSHEKISKYTLTCPVCGEKYYLNRKPTRAKGCGKHGGGYKPEYKLVLTQNY